MSTSRHLWTRDLLLALHAPGSLANVWAIIAQIQAEGGSARFNPLNTTLRVPGSTPYNSVGVQNYTTYRQGLDATVSTLKQDNMRSLLQALRSGASARDYWLALGASPWGTHPPGGSIDVYLQDIAKHWMARAMLPISGTQPPSKEEAP